MQLPDFIEIETSKFCNRRCGWCPNGPTGSRTDQELMPWELFARLITEIATYDFTGWLALHNYNEPLANPRLLTELSFIAAALPSCKPSIFTNGDLLTRELLIDLVDHGVAYLRVMRYPPPGIALAEPSPDCLQEWLTRMRLLDSCTWDTHLTRQGYAATATLRQLQIEIIAPAISRYNWRGGTTALTLGRERKRPCSLTTRSAAIDFRGRLKMCCNVYPESPEHTRYVIGSVASASFAGLWDSALMNELRQAHRRADWTLSPICAHCTQYLPTDEVNAVRGKRE